MAGQLDVSREEAERHVGLVDHFLALGHPVETKHGDRTTKSAVRMAADLLGLNRVSFAYRIGKPDAPGAYFRAFQIAPDWSIPAVRGEFCTRPAMAGFAIKAVATQRDAEGNLEREWVQQTRAPGPVEAVPDGHVVKGVSILQDGQGRILAKWVKTREGADPLDLVETIKAAFADYPGCAAPVAAPKAVREDLLTLLPCADWHIGMYAWGAEAGANWDLKLAEEAIGRAVAEAIERSPASAECVVLGGGDLLHADNSENRTARSGNALQVDGRWPKVLMAACKLMVRTVELCLRRHRHVTVRILPGNHDENSAVAVAYFLKAWFRKQRRVRVDLDPSLFWWFRWGDVLLGATHGHTVKAEKMAGIMAHRRAADWGVTRHRYVHTFHLHHTAKIASEGDGVVTEVHRSPVPQDAWHFGSGFLSGRSIPIITYHQRRGEYGRSVVPIDDAGEAEEAAA
ncbi:metallophosphoesterase family protein [Methylobacterium fujisawaense]|uniref:hypothetical protein n=1 Tax=Methylobacterium fujisawaense TaxID=107400 RepID=UPI00313ED334